MCKRRAPTSSSFLREDPRGCVSAKPGRRGPGEQWVVGRVPGRGIFQETGADPRGEWEQGLFKKLKGLV